MPFAFNRLPFGDAAAGIPILLTLMPMLCAGCRSPGTRIDLIDYPTGGPEASYFQQFDQCYFHRNADRSLDIIARREPKANETSVGSATQIVHIHVFYEAWAGRSPADPTMTNALVSYLLMSDEGAYSFDGGGFISWKESRDGSKLTVYLERAALLPQRSLGAHPPIFERPRITGRLSAIRNDRKVVTWINDLRRTLGPLPDKPPPMTDPSLR